MNVRNRLAALLAAGSLAMAVGAVALAAPPTYTFTVDKTANPTAVPPSGGTVVFSIAVDATGTGHLAQVNVSDSMPGCTVGSPTGDTDTDGNLDTTETWVYQCTVNNVTPGMSNTATVNGCHSAGVCNNSNHDHQAQDTVTLGEGAEPTQGPTQPPATDPPATDPPATDPPATDPPATDPPATDPPATDPPATDPPATDPPATDSPEDTFDPGGGEAGESDDPAPSQAETDTISGGTSGPKDTTWMLVLSLGLLLASLVVVSPPSALRNRGR